MATRWGQWVGVNKQFSKRLIPFSIQISIIAYTVKHRRVWLCMGSIDDQRRVVVRSLSLPFVWGPRGRPREAVDARLCARVDEAFLCVCQQATERSERRNLEMLGQERGGSSESCEDRY